MQQNFTKKYMLNNCGCYTKQRLLSCSFMVQEDITLESILKSEIPVRDKYWFVCKKLTTKEQNKQIAIAVAELVLPLFDRRYPEDKRPREAIEAAKAFIAGHISLDELIIKGRYAANAYAAAA